MKIWQQSWGKVNKAAEVTLGSMLLIAVFEERVETATCDAFSLGSPQRRDPINDSVYVQYVCACAQAAVDVCRCHYRVVVC